MKEPIHNLRWFKKLVANSQDLIAILNEQMELVFISESCETLLGYKSKEFTGRKGSDFFYTADLNRLVEGIESTRNDPGHHHKGRYKVTHKNKSSVYLELIITNLLHDPDIQGFVINAHDVSDQHQSELAHKLFEKKLATSERKYRGLYESVGDGIVETDLNGCIRHANRAFLEMLGYDKLDDLTGKYYQAITPEKWQSAEAIIVKNKIMERGYSDLYEKEYIRKDGSLVPVELRVWLMKEDGIPTGMWGIARDITDRWVAHKKLEEAYRQLELFNRYKSEEREKERKAIASTIHDELGQALTALKIDIGWLLEHAEATAECKTRMNSMTTIVDDAVETVQRISADLRPGILDDLGLAAAIEWYCEAFEKRTGIACKLDLCLCSIDKEVELPLFRIMQEALTNIARHAGASKVEIIQQCDDQNIELIIEDDGKGIDIEQINSNNSFGLIGMREKAAVCGGDFSIMPKEKGTRIQVVIPKS